MVAPLREVLVKRPGEAFARAFDDPAHGFLHEVDLAAAQREHDALCTLLADLGATVHELGEEYDPDLTYTFDPALVTDRGVLPLYPGKPNRVGEERVIERWMNEHGVPTVGRLEGDARAEGGDTFWLDDRTLAVGRTLRTNRAGVDQLASILQHEVEVEVYDVPFWRGAGGARAPDVCDLAGGRRRRRRLPATPPLRPARGSAGPRHPADRGAGRGVS